MTLPFDRLLFTVFILSLAIFQVNGAPQHAYAASWLDYLGIRQAGTYTNPIVKGVSADPWVLQYNDSYYLLATMPGGVSVLKSNNIAEFNDSEPVQVFKPSGTVPWAPELHLIDDNLYIYVALPVGSNDGDRRMHVLVGSNSSDPTAPFTDEGIITSPDNNWAIDGTVLHNYNGKNYFIWSGHDPVTGNTQNLYIAEMGSPTTLVGERVLLHSPFDPDGSKKAWQWAPNNLGINEGPEILVHGNQTFIVYSACSSQYPCYCLGIMGLNGTNLNPLDPKAWWTKDDGPVFSSSNVTVGVGHASFPYDAKGTPYIVYHGWGAKEPDGWQSRRTRAQPFSWNDDGTPNFPKPVDVGVELPLPAGF